LRLITPEERQELLEHLLPLKAIKQRIRLRVAALTPGERAKTILDNSDDEVIGENLPNILGSDVKQPKPRPRSQSVFVNSAVPDVYDLDRLAHEVQLENGDIVDDRCLPDDFAGPLHRSQAAVKLRSDEIDAQAAAVAGRNRAA